MKRILSLLLAIVGLLTAPVAFAQTATSPFPVPWYFASAYGNWGLIGQAPNTYVFVGASTCNQNAQGTVFFPFATNAPVQIIDSVTANNEVVTPSAIIKAGGQCGISVSPSHTHNSFTLRSGTGGLQEALNAIGAGSSSYVALLLLDRNWYVYASNVTGTTPAAIIAAAVGNANIVVEDITTAPQTYYTWNGSHYVAVAGNTAGRTPPTITVGAAAGTGGTATIVPGGQGNTFSVTVAAGTSTTTGTIFTATWPTSGSFTYPPNCTVTSTGANQYLTGTVTPSYTASHAILTFNEASAALTASTSYTFAVNCR